MLWRSKLEGYSLCHFRPSLLFWGEAGGGVVDLAFSLKYQAWVEVTNPNRLQQPLLITALKCLWYRPLGLYLQHFLFFLIYKWAQ